MKKWNELRDRTPIERRRVTDERVKEARKEMSLLGLRGDGQVGAALRWRWRTFFLQAPPMLIDAPCWRRLLPTIRNWDCEGHRSRNLVPQVSLLSLWLESPISTAIVRTHILTAPLGVVQVIPMFRDTNWTKGSRFDSTLADSSAVR